MKHISPRVRATTNAAPSQTSEHHLPATLRFSPAIELSREQHPGRSALCFAGRQTESARRVCQSFIAPRRTRPNLAARSGTSANYHFDARK